MALTALVWPIVLAGIVVPSFATFLLGFFTVPELAKSWVRLAMLVLAGEPKPALRERVVAAARVLVGQSNGH